MGVMSGDKDHVEVDAFAFESVVGMAERRRVLDRERRNGVKSIGDRATCEKSCSLVKFVVGDAEIPFLAIPPVSLAIQKTRLKEEERRRKKKKKKTVVHLGNGRRRRTSKLKRPPRSIQSRAPPGSGLPRGSPRYHGRRTRGPDRASMWGRPLLREGLTVVGCW